MISNDAEVQTKPVEAPAPVTDSEFDDVVSMRLSDLIRQGAQQGGKQAQGWGDGVETSCALTAAGVAARKMGYRAGA